MVIKTSEKKQITIKKEVTLKGVGLHTGKEVKMTLKPAPKSSGFVFCRVDLEGHPKIKAVADFVSDIRRGTILDKEGVKIMTCEHILAALVGMDIDNALIEIDSAELPIMDGSSKHFVKLIEKAGKEEQNAFREELIIDSTFHYRDESTGSEVSINPSEAYKVISMIDFDTQVLGTQNAHLNQLSDFKEEISKARTFCFLHELEMLLDNNLIKGGDLNNAIVYIDKELSPLTLKKLKKVFQKNDIASRPNGILDNLDLHYPNEAARHKLLDVVGDLALVGIKIKGCIIANKPGHKTNTEVAKILYSKVKQLRRDPIFKIDLSAPPVMEVTEIMKYLPHRPPFLLVDRIMELTKTRVVGVKNVTINEPFFQGHFPSTPIMPGVLQIETMAQVGGVLVLGTVPDPENYLTYFMKIEQAKFKKQVVPGNTIICVLELLAPIRRGVCYMKGKAYVNGRVCTEATLMAQIVKTKNN